MSAASSHVNAPRWLPLLEGGRYNAAVREVARGASGAYAFRDRSSGRVLYVGESHTGRLWKTAIRHVHGQRSFARVGEWTHDVPGRLDVAVWLCAPDEALELEAALIEALDPVHNELWTEEVPAWLDDEDLDNAEAPPPRENPRRAPAAGDDRSVYLACYREALAQQEAVEAATVAYLRTGEASYRRAAEQAVARMYQLADRMRPLRDRHGWKLPPLYLMSRSSRADAAPSIVERATAATRRTKRARRSNPGAPRHNAAAAADFKRMHWGLAGDDDPQTVAVPVLEAGEQLVALGQLTAVEYATEKGADGPSTYRHELEDPLPTLAYALHTATGRREGLFIVGGGYLIEERGIVG